MATKTQPETVRQTVRQIIAGRMEPAEPQATILTFLQGINGKTLTSAHEKKLQALLPGAEISLNRQFGMTNIQYGGYQRTQGNQGGSLLIGYNQKVGKSERAIEVDAAWVEEHNPAYFIGAVQRNIERKAILATDKPERIEAAVNAYNKALAELNSLIADIPDKYRIEELKSDHGKRR